ncbi:hypothetical protein NQ315_005359 [Exocentrus adspersus]|uniref:Fibronectin type-III domain-containing protein n=1 Tax=Exocentrus adspersus TaxID=1586481 RepID=A0AAV8W2B5_9CUCU|nr:hypothetical protein NQ315_005359 [Exocentrus adspersus]
MDKKEILDTLKAARIYLNRLQSLDNELENAVKQITTTFEETERNIRQTFSNLKQAVVGILNKREAYLLDQAEKIKKEGLAPLEECRCIVSNKVDTTSKLITLGSSIVNESAKDVLKFSKNASLLGSLPEVPELKEVPFLSFHHDPASESEIVDILSHFGEVCRIAPVQITELCEKPGGILVEWNSIDDDEKLTDIQEFKLQRAFGDVIKEKHLLVNFHDCYLGQETQFLVKDLKVDQPYSFRVCCKFEGNPEWSPWSLPQVKCTSLKPFCWKPHEDHTLSNENKIAKPVTNSPTILYSDGPQFCVGHSVEFTFLEADSNTAVIGLISQELTNSSNLIIDQPERQPGEPGTSFLINSNGKIFVDRVEKCTKLSDFAKGLKVCFTSILVNDHKVRINVDCNEKVVTYDWLIDPDSRMYFVAQLPSSNWKVMVE